MTLLCSLSPIVIDSPTGVIFITSSRTLNLPSSIAPKKSKVPTLTWKISGGLPEISLGLSTSSAFGLYSSLTSTLGYISLNFSMAGFIYSPWPPMRHKMSRTSPFGASLAPVAPKVARETNRTRKIETITLVFFIVTPPYILFRC